MMLAQETLFFLGKIPHPSTGKGEVNLEVAKMRIDQLEIIELKTRGNRTEEEEDALKQALQAVRLAFVEVAGVGARESLNGESEKSDKSSEKQSLENKPQSTVSPPVPDDKNQSRKATPDESATNESDSSPKKRYSKSYGAL